MPSRGVFFSPRSRRDLKGLAREDQLSILSGIEGVSLGAKLPPPPKVRKLQGSPSLYRLRSGDFRTIFRLAPEGLYVLRVVPRRELERALAGIW